MVQWSLSGRRVTMDTRREVALVDVVLASGTTKFMWKFILKIARWFDGGDDFYSMCMRYSYEFTRPDECSCFS
jgi:hypothetical protein